MTYRILVDGKPATVTFEEDQSRVVLIDCSYCSCPDQGEPTAPTERCMAERCVCHSVPEPDYMQDGDS